MKPVMIEVGLNEAAERSQVPHVPYSPAEIADDIVACAAAGASIIHFHARDAETGAQRLDDTALYREAMAAVRGAGSDVMMYPTYSPFLSGSGDPVAERFGHVLALVDDPEIRMEMAPLDMGSLNLAMSDGGRLLRGERALPMPYSVFLNPMPLLEQTLAVYDEKEIICALAVFEPGHLRLTTSLLDEGLGRRAMLKFFMSARWLHGPLPDPDGLDFYLRMLAALGGKGAECEWFCIPSGMDEPGDVERLLRAAIERGGHVRVGVGDTPVAASGRSNPELVARVVAIAAEYGRPPATVADVRSFAKVR